MPAQIDQAAVEKVVETAQSVGAAQNLDHALLKLKNKIIEVFKVDRVTVYSFDNLKRELFTNVDSANEPMEIRVALTGDSMAGYTAKSGQVVAVKDAYNSEELKQYPGCKFDNSWDAKSGFKTEAVLSLPIRYREVSGNQVKDTGLQGVIQLLRNKVSSPFNEIEINHMKRVSVTLAVALFNQKRVKKKPPSKFGLLLEKSLISEEDLNKAIEKARAEQADPIRGDVACVLINDNGISKTDVGESLAAFYNTKFIAYDDEIEVSEENFQGLNENFLRSRFFVPLTNETGVLTVLIDDPSNLHRIDEIRSILAAREHIFCVGIREDILSFIDLATGKKGVTQNLDEIAEDLDDDDIAMTESDKDEVADMLNDDAPIIVRMVNKIIQDAYEAGVSDIHIEPYPGKQPAIIRYRLDGACSKHTEVSATHIKALVNRIKIMATLKVDEKRFPQSGKIKLKYGNKDVELRVETTPTVGGLEDVVMRILAAGKPLPLDKMNFSESNLKYLFECIENPYGLFLTVGPTGSGKTTTLHSILGYLNKPDTKIWTAEDPVEITQYGLRQVQVNPNIKPVPFDFALAMRSFLRADPDIIMVGEMRDKETAHMGIEASLTGHLVLSTLHTNSAPETITRLIDMGLNPINFADALLGILAQRLVRTLCGECKEEYKPSEEEWEIFEREYGPELVGELEIDKSTQTFCKPIGCDKCSKGHRGRTGVHELLVGSKAIKKMIMERATVEEMRILAITEGMRTLKMDGFKKVLLGQTDMAQVRRVCID
ncbi:MAG: GspE/PulE family protein [Deltaproteobacteria bacterium]|nr:GspE/PulE family protein [Deltaproteobacteria bacterium]